LDALSAALPNRAPLLTEDILFSLGEHADGHEDPYAAEGQAVIPPIYQTANFRFPNTASLRRALSDEYGSHLYTRGNNPTTELLRQKLAALEGAEDALVFASGVAAVSAAVLSTVKSGDHVVCVRDPYPWTAWLLRDWLPRFGVTHSFVDGTSVSAFQEAFQPNTRLVMLESPNSFWFDLQDLEAIAALAGAIDCATVVDNSYASPLLQNPLAMGIDLVVHSASKYLNGHGDLVAGVVCGSSKRIRKMYREEFQGLGGILAPHEAWLMLRGLRTLGIRMERIGKTASILVERLALDPRVHRVHYPFHPSHPQHALALRQMKGPSGQFSIELATEDPTITEAFCDALRHFQLAVSWGGFESLVIPAIAKSADHPSPALVRFCAGLEHPDTLWADLLQALDQVEMPAMSRNK